MNFDSLRNPVLVGALILISLTGVTGCKKSGGGPGGGNVATVNGEPIDMDTYYRYLEIKPTVQVETPQGLTNAKVTRSLGFQGMTDLIKQTLIMQIAKKDGVYPTKQDIEKEIEFRKRGDANFLKNLYSMGLTIDMIQRDLTISICEDRILTKGIKVTDQEVNSYISDNPSQFVIPATADLLWILVQSDQQKNLAEKDLASGQKFDQVAARYSEAKDARQMQYRYPIRVLNQMSPALKSMVSTLAEGQSSQWIQQGKTWLKFYVDKKTPEKAQKVDDTMREFVRRKLARDRGASANDLDARIREALKNAKIDIGSKMLKDTWSREMESFRADGTKATK